MANKRIKGYSPTTKDELNAISVLKYLFDNRFIKPHINEYDKIPNHDGRIEITDMKDVFVAEFIVQVKKAPKKQKNKYQFDIPFFYYCSQCLNPVLTFLVDVEGETAYWEHFEYETLEKLKLLNQKTVTIRFNEKRKITKNDNQYIDEWVEIFKSERRKRIDFEKVSKENAELKIRLKVISELKDPSYNSRDERFPDLHRFIDNFNRLIDFDFQIVKKAYYQNVWKIGFAIDEYKQNRLSFITYPIEYNKNDTLIKLITDYNREQIYEISDRFLLYNIENPIRNRPFSFVYEMLEDLTMQLVKDKALFYIDVAVAQETLTDFIDKLYFALGLKKNQQLYSISTLETALTEFLPLWYESANIFSRENNPTSNRLNLIIINVESPSWFMSTSEIDKITKKAKLRHKKNERVAYPFKLVSTEFNMVYIMDCLEILKMSNEQFISRPYALKDMSNTKISRIWELYDIDKLTYSIRSYFRNFQKSYDEFVKDFFPLLVKEICYFQEFNRVIVLIDQGIEPCFVRDGYEINIVYLKNITNPFEQRVDVYCLNNANESPISKMQLKNSFDNFVTIDNMEYKFQGRSMSAPRFIFDDRPLYNGIYDLLKERLERFFKEKILQPQFEDKKIKIFNL